jgi:hypothetical protein
VVANLPVDLQRNLLPYLGDHLRLKDIYIYCHICGVTMSINGVWIGN